MPSWFISFLRRLTSLRAEDVPLPDPPITRFILTIWKRSQLSDDWANDISAFDAVSLKIVDRNRPHEIDLAMGMAGQIASRGVRVHGWGWHHCTDKEETLEEVEEAVRRCEEVGATGYHWNAERIWSEGSDPAQMGLLFARTFKSRLPDVTLYANCFRSMVNSDMISAMDFYEPMLYGTRVSTIAGKFDREFSRGISVPEKMAVMVGTGRMDGDRDDRAWGYVDDRGDVPGLSSLIKEYRPRWVNFFRGGQINDEDMMSRGNSINPALSEQVRTIRDVLSRGVA
tara:strand:- start:514 stop:1365 length:852 start_codon:yes stop_codon:yes gene_type:complete